MADEALFRSEDIEVTPTHVRFYKTTYDIADIGSVTIVYRRAMNGYSISLIALSFGVLILTAARGGGEQQSFIWIGLGIAIALVLTSFVMQNAFPVKTYRLLFVTSNGDVEPLVSQDRPLVYEVKQAIEHAIIHRTLDTSRP